MGVRNRASVLALLVAPQSSSGKSGLSHGESSPKSASEAVFEVAARTTQPTRAPRILRLLVATFWRVTPTVCPESNHAPPRANVRTLSRARPLQAAVPALARWKPRTRVPCVCHACCCACGLLGPCATAQRGWQRWQ